jgi:hypothetical protein
MRIIGKEAQIYAPAFVTVTFVDPLEEDDAVGTMNRALVYSRTNSSKLTALVYLTGDQDFS